MCATEPVSVHLNLRNHEKNELQKMTWIQI